MWLVLTDERACFVRHQFPSGKLSQPTQCTMYTEAAYGKAGAFSTASRPVFRTMVQIDCSWPAHVCTSLHVQFSHPHKNLSFGGISGLTLTFYYPPACHTPSTTHAFFIPEPSLPEFWPEHPLALLPTMAYAPDACFHLSTTCCTHAPPHALVLRSGLGYRSSSSPSIPAPASPLVLRSPSGCLSGPSFPLSLTCGVNLEKT
ncbi:hypothetical protein B0T20DRAFT_56762 [Sordaria brevicollis]|uniref:Uncharacterized protein n=1 Tax=Sordaria brevicollis TaxID=83679 RepID=A0AAE0U6J4_SORBR|nr:hypothetical protein B0T20DRAFT_56762 [Sordaria brevicollis]